MIREKQPKRKEKHMAGTRFFTGQDTEIKKNLERKLDQPRQTQFFDPKKERMGTERTANILLIDNSGSEDQAIGNGDNRKKIDGIKEAATTHVIGLPSEAYLSVIKFSDYATVLAPLSQVGSNKLNVVNGIQTLAPENSTNMIAGLESAEKEFEKAPEGYIKRLYLLTDGLPNEDPSYVAERLKYKSITLITIGFGDSQTSLDEDLLRKMASTSQKTGAPLYYYIRDAKNLTGFLKRESTTISI